MPRTLQDVQGSPRGPQEAGGSGCGNKGEGPQPGTPFGELDVGYESLCIGGQDSEKANLRGKAVWLGHVNSELPSGKLCVSSRLR